ncbi:hypothetical protein PIIN_07865 [Serendipita indica DSM 11827]|uniref:Senescence domain-containing protein n=1 Tax=Serendipita indica (strain DSM 11827) TaxID=1109443 RepID=G4TRH9_SERID|nr:hypothetical protein PIIN_07865 [Serendipita indica DSM 11827]
MSLVPPSPIGNTPTSTNAEGFLLLTISNAILTSTAFAHPVPTPIVGTLSLECVTINVSDPLERDVWLVLRVEPPLSPVTNQPHAGHHGFEYPLPATQKIVLNRTENRYTMPVVSGGELTIRLPKGLTAAQKEDLETLEVLLAQYAVLHVQEGPVPDAHGAPGSRSSPTMSNGMVHDADGDLKGRLVLVDEDNGQIVGTLGDQFEVREDATLNMDGHEKDPVVVEIPDDEQWGTGRGWSTGEDGRPRVQKQIFVHPITVDDSDWMSKTAGFLGRGIVFATNAVTTGVTSATNLYISKSAPATEPIVFSETTKRNVKRVHNISGKAVQVTAKTTGLIHQTVERLADKVSGHKPAPPPSSHPHSGTSTPGSGWNSPYPGGSTTSLRGPNAFGPTSAAHTPPPPPPKRRLLNRLLTSTDLILTTVEQSAHHLISHTTNSLSAAAHHKYGPDAGKAVGMMGESVKNVGVVYIDARGVGRRALLKCAGKRIIKAKMGGRDVVFQDQGAGKGTVMVDEKTHDGAPVGVTHGPPPGAPPSFGAPPPYPPPMSTNALYAPYKRGTQGP